MQRDTHPRCDGRKTWLSMAEANLSPVGLWDALNADRFYAREQLGPMQWADLRLDEMRCCFTLPLPRAQVSGTSSLCRSASLRSVHRPCRCVVAG